MSTNSTSDPFSLNGQVALVTGGGTGLGEAIAAGLHRAGARVVIVGRREAELARSAERIGPGATYLVHDLTQLAAADGLIARISAEVGPIDCLVNNAGIHLKKPALDTSVEEFQQVLTTHVLGAHALTRAVAPGMIARQGGSILFIASMASLFGIPQVVAYSAAKSAYLGMVRTLATEWSSHGVRVNAIAPGWIETPMSSKALAGDPARRQKILGRTPMARLGQPDDVAWSAVYLASPAARFVTGVVLPVDGGASIGF
jgi:gluconate 5-dehydrogenase